MSAIITAVAAMLLISSPDESVVQSGYAKVNGVKMYYELRGAGPAVVLLHGGLNTIETTFSKLLPDLVRKYRVVGVEQVGHGHSPDIDRPYSYTQMADDTAALLAQLRIGPADLIGWSDGGIIALLIAIRHPERVRRIITSGANTRVDGLSENAINWIKEFSPDDKDLAKSREAYGRVSPDGPARWPFVANKDRTLWLATPVIIEKEKLASVTAPTMIISGDHDVVLLEHSVEIFRTLPNAQLCILPETGHTTFDRRTDWMFPMISAFLDAPEKPAK